MERETVKEKANSLGAEIFSFSDNFHEDNVYTLKKDLPIDQFFEEAVYNEYQNVWVNKITNREIVTGKKSFVSNYIDFEENKPKQAEYQLHWENGEAADGSWISDPDRDLAIWNIKAKFKDLPEIVEIDLIGERQSQYGGNQLPVKENNIAGQAQINKEIINSEDWLKAKSGDINAGMRVVERVWSQKKTDQLKKIIGNPDSKVLVTMPSTSRKNIIPIVLAQKLAKDIGVQVIYGDKYFDVLHRNEIKNISRFERIFYNREYKMNESFEKNIQNKKATLIDDIFTTGGSVKNFSKALSINELEVCSVVGLMGDKRLRIDDKTESKLKDVLLKNNINIDINRLSNMLTRTEAGMLIQRINREGIKNEKLRELAGKLQRLVKGLSVKDITRNRITGRDQGTEKSYSDNERNVKEIQGRGARGGYGR